MDFEQIPEVARFSSEEPAMSPPETEPTHTDAVDDAREKKLGIFSHWPVALIAGGIIASLLWTVLLGWLLLLGARALF
jgi:hypothetical protein